MSKPFILRAHDERGLSLQRLGLKELQEIQGAGGGCGCAGGGGKAKATVTTLIGAGAGIGVIPTASQASNANPAAWPASDRTSERRTRLILAASRRAAIPW